MRLLKGILVWPLLWLMRRFHLGDGPTRDRVRRQLIEHMREFNHYENPEDFWK